MNVIYKKITLTQRLKRIKKNIDKDAFVYKLKKFVKNINYSKLEDSLFKSNYGQHRIPLYVPLGIWIFTYSQGILSYREVCNKCKKDDDYYYLSEGFEPSGSYLLKYKYIYFPLIKDLLVKFNKMLIDNKIIDNVLLGLDGVKVEIWSSLRQSKTENSINKEIDRINKSLLNDISRSKKNYYKTRRKKLKKTKNRIKRTEIKY